MVISAIDAIPLSRARANFSEAADEGKAVAEKIVTKNSGGFIQQIDEASKGLDDVAAGRVKDARSAIQSIKCRRSA